MKSRKARKSSLVSPFTVERLEFSLFPRRLVCLSLFARQTDTKTQEERKKESEREKDDDGLCFSRFSPPNECLCIINSHKRMDTKVKKQLNSYAATDLLGLPCSGWSPPSDPLNPVVDYIYFVTVSCLLYTLIPVFSLEVCPTVCLDQTIA